MGTQLLSKRGTASQFSAHVYCGETAGWMKTPLGMEVDLRPGFIVLDRDAVPPTSLHKKGTELPSLFCPCLLWPWSPILGAAELLCILVTMGNLIQLYCQKYNKLKCTKNMRNRCMKCETYDTFINSNRK